MAHRVVVDVGDGAGQHRLLAHQRRHVERGGAGVDTQLAPAAALAAADNVIVTTRAAIEPSAEFTITKKVLTRAFSWLTALT